MFKTFGFIAVNSIGVLLHILTERKATKLFFLYTKHNYWLIEKENFDLSWTILSISFFDHLDAPRPFNYEKQAKVSMCTWVTEHLRSRSCYGIRHHLVHKKMCKKSSNWWTQTMLMHWSINQVKHLNQSTALILPIE